MLIISAIIIENAFDKIIKPDVIDFLSPGSIY
jgi:hypothetical protein